ncbi:MAG: amidohydrolase family protein [Kiritimatiellae bacterium]|nr:amidohydrolase family protein [Kiritimatiellia bacterium]
MIIDIHTHLVSATADPAKLRLNVWNRILMRLLRLGTAEELRERFCRDLAEGPVERAVVCAVEHSLIAAGNREVRDFCRENPSFLFGANLNPLSPHVESDIDGAVHDGAVLIKLMPSYQNVDLADPRCDLFWDAVADRKLPVIVHTGPEHSLSRGNGSYNSPARLERAARKGVTLICAHCGCQLVSFVERSQFGAWKRLVRSYENVYGDVSGFGGCVRRFWLRRILRDPLLKSRIVFGTDYPSCVHVFRRNEENPFRAWHAFFKDAGLDNAFFGRGAKLLGLEGGV